MADKNWIQGAIKHPGSLRKAEHIKKGKKIPEELLDELIKKGGAIGRKASLAKTLRGFHKGE